MDEKLIPALQGLVDAGTLTNAQAWATQNALSLSTASSSQPEVVRGEIVPSVNVEHSRRAIISEALTYVGFVFVVAASALLTSQAWESLGRWGRPALFAAGAAVLFSAGLWMRQARRDDSGRRLSSTLFVGSEALVGGAIGLVLSELWIPKNPDWMDSSNVNWKEAARWVAPTIILLIGLGALAVGILSYVLSRSALGQLAMAIPSVAIVMSFGDLVNVWTSTDDTAATPRLGFFLMFLGGLAWLWFGSQGYLSERVFSQVLGVGALYIGMQGMGVDLGHVWIGSLGLILLGVALLFVYLRNRSWPFLAGGIIGMFGGGVRMLVEYVHGTSGALASLVLGILLVVFGVRIVGSTRHSMTVHAEALNGNGNSNHANPFVISDNSSPDASESADQHRNVEPF